MEDISSKYSHIKGWGIDADPENDPTYPMKNWTGADHERLNYEKPPQQPVEVEILQSIERPAITSVFGTSAPPRGLSGMIRRYAFKYSESTYAHWVPLVLADRINVVEGILEDFMHGHVPNIFSEKGWPAEWKYNRKAFAQKMLIASAVTIAAAVFLKKKNKRKKLKFS